MSRKDPVHFALLYTPIAALAAAIAIACLAGKAAVAGFAIGAALSIGSLLAGKMLATRGLSKVAKGQGIARVLVLFLLKFPVFVAVVFFVNSLGRRPVAYFLVGYLLVYFGLVTGAIFDRPAPSNFDEVL